MKVTIAILITMLGGICANAQTGNFTISYPISFPTGSLHSYQSNTSFRGISMEFNKQTSPMTTAGLEVGWNVFYQHVDTKVYTDGTASITGSQYRYTNAAPIIAGGIYQLHSDNEKMHPFVGLGIGTTYVERITDFGVYSLRTDSWQFCVRPELGFNFHTGRGTDLFLAAKYFWNFNTSELDGQSWLSVNIGVRMTY